MSVSSSNLDHDLAPPSLASMQSHHSDSLVLRSLYPNSGSSSSGSSGRENHAAFKPEPTVYRSVTIDSAGSGAFDHSPFDPLGQFDRGYPMSAYGPPSAKELNLNPKMQSFSTYQPADYKPTLKHSPQPQQQQQPIKLSAVVSPQASPIVAVTSAAAAAAASIASLHAPPPAPMWLEPNSHFFCSCHPPTTPALLFDTVQATLQSLHENSDSSADASICTLDCTPTPARFKLACTAYASRSGAATPFVVRIYTADAAKHKYCVEFQRRRGDVTHFYALFHTARSRIQAAHPLVEEGETVPLLQKAGSVDSLNLGSLDINLPQPLLRSWSAPALPAMSGADHSFSGEHLCDTVRSLLQMCASPCIDIKLNGVLALAELSCSPSFDASLSACGNFNLHETLVAEGCFKLFLDCLPIAQLDIHRASLTALANISATQSHVCSQVLADEKSMRCIYELANSGTHQVARECARLMSNCAGKLHTLANEHKPKFKECVQRLMHHQDAHCRQHAVEISNKMGETIGAQ